MSEGWMAALAFSTFMGGFLYVVLRIDGYLPPLRDPLKHPEVTWELYRSAGDDWWHWEVRVGQRVRKDTTYSKRSALIELRQVAKRFLETTDGEWYGKTHPCTICGQPAPVGEETDTAICANILEVARQELPPAVLPERLKAEN